MAYLDKIKQRFKEDKFASETTGIEIISAEPENKQNEMDGGAINVVTSLMILSKHKNSTGNVMGGVLFTLADYCFAIAANGLCKIRTVTLSSSIQFCGACKGNRITGKAECIKKGHKVSFYCITIKDDKENKIAEVSMTGYRIE